MKLIALIFALLSIAHLSTSEVVTTASGEDGFEELSIPYTCTAIAKDTASATLDLLGDPNSIQVGNEGSKIVAYHTRNFTMQWNNNTGTLTYSIDCEAE